MWYFAHTPNCFMWMIFRETDQTTWQMQYWKSAISTRGSIASCQSCFAGSIVLQTPCLEQTIPWGLLSCTAPYLHAQNHISCARQSFQVWVRADAFSSAVPCSCAQHCSSSQRTIASGTDRSNCPHCACSVCGASVLNQIENRFADKHMYFPHTVSRWQKPNVWNVDWKLKSCNHAIRKFTSRQYHHAIHTFQKGKLMMPFHFLQQRSRHGYVHSCIWLFGR